MIILLLGLLGRLWNFVENYNCDVAKRRKEMNHTNNSPNPSGTSPHKPSGSGGVRVPETGRGPRKPRK